MLQTNQDGNYRNIRIIVHTLGQERVKFNSIALAKGVGVNLTQKTRRDKWESISPKMFEGKCEIKKIRKNCQKSIDNLVKKGVGWNGEGTLN